MFNVVMIGAPGAGKGTQAKLLQAELALPQVSTGDLFRENLQRETELGKLAKSYMEQGVLVPDEVTIGMVKNRIGRDDCSQGVIFDGFPRTLSQAQALDSLLATMGAQVDLVPHIFVEQEKLITRLLKRAELEGRADDNEATIRTRMNVYQQQTAPLLAYYAEKGVLLEVDGELSIAEVYQQLLALIEPHRHSAMTKTE